MPSALDRALDKILGPVTEEDVADFEQQYGSGAQATAKKRTRGPGKNKACEYIYAFIFILLNAWSVLSSCYHPKL